MINAPEPASNTENVQLFSSHQPVESFQIKSNRLQTIGIRRSFEQNRVCEDVISIKTKQGDDSIKIVLSDGIGKDAFGSVTEVEAVSSLVTKFVKTSSGQVPIIDKNELRPLVSTDILTLSTGNYLVGSIGVKDCLSVAFVPGGDGKFTEDSLKILYFNPKAEQGYSNISYVDGKTINKGLQNPLLSLPKGSIVLNMSDGGLEALANLFGRVKHILIDNPGNLLDSDRYGALQHLFRPMLEYFNTSNGETFSAAKAIVEGLKDFEYGADDVSAVFTILDEQKADEKKFISPDLLKLVSDLSQEDDKTPMRPEEIIEKHGIKKAAKLVSQLVENDLTWGVFFSRACALVKPSELPEKTLRWFLDRGLKVLDGEDIKVFLTMNLKPFELRACHEIGQYVIDGTPAGQQYDEFMKEPPKYVAATNLHVFEADEHNPRGRMAEIRPWTGKRFAFVGTPIAGGGDRSRGILMPSDDFILGRIYLTDDSSFEKGAFRKFFIGNSGIHHFLQWAAIGVTQYLQGKIQTKSEYVASGGQSYFIDR